MSRIQPVDRPRKWSNAAYPMGGDRLDGAAVGLRSCQIGHERECRVEGQLVFLGEGAWRHLLIGRTSMGLWANSDRHIELVACMLTPDRVRGRGGSA